MSRGYDCYVMIRKEKIFRTLINTRAECHEPLTLGREYAYVSPRVVGEKSIRGA
jgi:hypothetical protein